MEWVHSPSDEYNRSLATQDEDHKDGSELERPNSSSKYNGSFELGDKRSANTWNRMNPNLRQKKPQKQRSAIIPSVFMVLTEAHFVDSK